MDDTIHKEAKMRKEKKGGKKAKLEQVLNLIKVQTEVERAIAEMTEASYQAGVSIDPETNDAFIVQEEVRQLEAALNDSHVHLARLDQEATELRDLLESYKDYLNRQSEATDQFQHELSEYRSQKSELMMKREEEQLAAKLVRLAEAQREADDRKKDANDQLARLQAERIRVNRLKREAVEKQREEEERQRREVARAEIAKVMQEEGIDESTMDRDWIKKMQQYGAGARTIRAQVENKNPSVLNFREKMLKFM